MILSTVTLNPAIDKTYFVRNFAANALNRVDRIKTNMGGKGINISAAAACCGISCIAGGFLSGYNGQMIGKYLKDLGVTTDFVYTEGETRVNVKVVDTENHTYTDINEPGPAVTAAELESLYAKLGEMAIKSDVVYMGGSVHASAGDDIYKRMVEIVKSKGALAVLDADGEPLRCGVTAHPDVIKPNQQELECLIGRKIKSVADAAAAAAEIAANGVQTVLVTLGGNGAVAARDGALYRVYPLNVPVNSTTGAGDSFLSGYLYGISRSEDLPTALKYAMAFSAAKVRTEGTDIPPFEELRRSVDKVNVELMDN